MLKKSYVVVVVLIFVLYLLTAARTNVGYGDSDGFLAVSNNLGLMHPPGYGLYTLALYIFNKIMPFGNLAMKASLLTIIFSIFTLIVVYKIVLKETKRVGAGLLSMILLGVNQLFWQYSILAEKYALNNLLTAMVIYTTTLKKYFWAGLLLGIALSYHQSGLLLLPLVIFGLWRGKKKALAGVILGVFINLLLMISINSLDRNINWHFENSFMGVINQLIRSEISGTDEVSGVSRTFFGLNIPNWELLTAIYSRMGWLFLGLVVWGVYNGIKGKRYSLLLGFLGVFIGIFVTTKWPSSLGSQAIVERWFIQAMVVSAIITGLGIKRLSKWIVLGVLAVVLWGVWKTYPVVNLSKFSFIHDYYQSLMKRIPENAIVYCDTDVSCMSMLYLQEGEGLRKDLVIVTAAYPLIADRLKEIEDLQGFNYKDNPMRMLDIISWNMNKRPVLVVDFQPSHRNYLGLEYGFFYFVPFDGFGQIVKERPNDVGLSKYVDVKLNNNLMQKYFRANIAYFSELEARAYKRLNEIEKAEFAHENAQTIGSGVGDDFDKWMEEFESMPLGVKNYVFNSKKLIIDDILSEAEIAFENGDKKKAFFGYLGAVLRDPTNTKALEKLSIHQADFDLKLR